MHKDDGGPAFPKPHDPYPNVQGHVSLSGARGMSLRDWFAGQVLAGLIARDGAEGSDNFRLIDAKTCYAQADAMLAARKQEATRDAG